MTYRFAHFHTAWTGFPARQICILVSEQRMRHYQLRNRGWCYLIYTFPFKLSLQIYLVHSGYMTLLPIDSKFASIWGNYTLLCKCLLLKICRTYFFCFLNFYLPFAQNIFAVCLKISIFYVSYTYVVQCPYSVRCMSDISWPKMCNLNK